MTLEEDEDEGNESEQSSIQSDDYKMIEDRLNFLRIQAVYI